MKRSTKIGLLIAFLSLTQLSAVQGLDYRVLYDFGPTTDGFLPGGDLIVHDATLYGMTANGGSNQGRVFSIGADGSGYNILHSFNSAEGGKSVSGLTLVGSDLFGMTYGITFGGGVSSFGQIFKINLENNNYSTLHAFVGYPSDGANPIGGLTLSNSTLYSTTRLGGVGAVGTVFQVGTDGGSYNVLHSFGGTDGAYPVGNLLASGSMLYGMTQNNIFAIDASSGNCTSLHTWGGLDTGDGDQPNNSLTLVGSTLFGMTTYGGAKDINGGVIFKMNLDGSGYTILHTFTAGGIDGLNPVGKLTLVGDTLYGVTKNGGAYSGGTIFAISTDGADYSLAYSFGGTVGDGFQPSDSLILDGSTLYGMTSGSVVSRSPFGPGVVLGNGTIFALTVPEPSAIAIMGIGALAVFTFRFCQNRQKRK
jgi:uncharacterized repeat protein (TIGR03803 family)